MMTILSQFTMLNKAKVKNLFTKDYVFSPLKTWSYVRIPVSHHHPLCSLSLFLLPSLLQSQEPSGYLLIPSFLKVFNIVHCYINVQYLFQLALLHIIFSHFLFYWKCCISSFLVAISYSIVYKYHILLIHLSTEDDLDLLCPKYYK